MTSGPPKFQRPVSGYAPPTSFDWARRWHAPVLAAFASALVTSSALSFAGAGLHEARPWADALVFLLAAATTFVSLSRRLPAQNVFAAATGTAVLASLSVAAAINSGIPFGPIAYTHELAFQMAGAFPMAVPLLWIAVIINGRGLARLILRPWRTVPHYGFWVIGLTAVLAVGFDLALEPFATNGRQWWQWEREIPGPAWFGTPWLNFFGWAVTALFILLVVTPLLIKKQPVPQPDDFQPLIVWLLLSAWLAVGNAAHGNWPVAAFGIVSSSLIGIAVRFATRRRMEIYRT